MTEVEQTVQKMRRYLDGLFRCMNGKPITQEEMDFDLRFLKALVRRRLKRPGALANVLGVKMHDKVFQECLERLQALGLIVYTAREWAFDGRGWVALAEDEQLIAATAKGENLEADPHKEQ